MKRLAIFFVIVVACAAIGWATYLVAAPAPPPLSGIRSRRRACLSGGERLFRSAWRLEFFCGKETVADQ